MAHIRRLGLLNHLRADPNQHILHYRRGRLVRSGRGLAYWFNPLAASVAQIPAEDIESTLVLNERSRDFQEVTVQATLIYRCGDPEKLAARFNFAIALDHGSWIETPLERLASFWRQKIRGPARSYLAGTDIVEAVRSGASIIAEQLEASLRDGPELADAGLIFVTAQVDTVAPSAELEKAIQTPTREALQQKADEATFERRAIAVEKERAIKENELATEIELARRQQQLISQEGSNELEKIRLAADSEKLRIESEIERQQLAAVGSAKETTIRAEADAEASKLLSDVELSAEAQRVGLWSEAPSRVHLGLALQELAGSLPQIEHLNITPDLVGQALQKLLRDMNNSS